jgi:hypothetical protein
VRFRDYRFGAAALGAQTHIQPRFFDLILSLTLQAVASVADFAAFHLSFHQTKESSMTALPLSIRKLTVVTAATLLASTTVLAAGTAALADAQARYVQDMAACNSADADTDLAACRLEARNALAEAKRGGLNDATDQYQPNALRRCDAHQGDDRAACEKRMRGEGRVDGSVSGGGILRQIETIIPAK